jgi:hypothetical protein
VGQENQLPRTTYQLLLDHLQWQLLVNSVLSVAMFHSEYQPHEILCSLVSPLELHNADTPVLDVDQSTAAESALEYTLKRGA